MKITRNIAIRRSLAAGLCLVLIRGRHNNFKFVKSLVIIFIFIISLNSCCGFLSHKPFVEKLNYNDTVWFPYHPKSRIAYISSDKVLTDTLEVVKFETSVGEYGTECPLSEEEKYCKLKSQIDKNFEFDIRLRPAFLNLNLIYSAIVVNENHYISSQNAYDNNFKDSILIDNVLYKNVLYVGDSINDVELFYNDLGIIQYKIKNETFRIINN